MRMYLQRAPLGSQGLVMVKALPQCSSSLISTPALPGPLQKLCTGDLHDAAVRRAEQRAIMRAHQRRPRMGGEGQGPAPRRRAPPAAFSGGDAAAGRPPVGAAPVAATGVVSGLAAGRMGSLHRSTSV